MRCQTQSVCYRKWAQDRAPVLSTPQAPRDKHAGCAASASGHSRDSVNEDNTDSVSERKTSRARERLSGILPVTEPQK